MGTIELIPGTALIDFDEETGKVYYSGETKVFWDGQETQLGPNGYPLLECDTCHCEFEAPAGFKVE